MKANSILLLFALFAGAVIVSCETETPEPKEDPISNVEKKCKPSMILDRGDQVVYEFGYNANGEVVRVVNERGTSTYPNNFWIDKGNVVGVLYNSFNLRSEFSFKLDGNGNIVERQLMDSLTGQIRFWDYSYDSEGKLIEILESKQNPGTGFKQQLGKEKYIHNGNNVSRQEVYVINHSPGSNPQVSLSMVREFSYDSNMNPMHKIFFNGPNLLSLNKNNIVLISETPAGGSLNTIAYSYEFNDENYPILRKDGRGTILLKYFYTDC